MSNTAMIALLAEMKDVDGSIFARVRGLAQTPPRRAHDHVLLLRGGELLVARGGIAHTFEGTRPHPPTRLRAFALKDSRAYREVTRPITELMDRHLGSSESAWARLFAALPTYDGPLVDAIEAAGTGTATPRPRVPRGAGLAVRHLLLLAPPERLADLVPALPAHTVRDLVRFGARLPDHVVVDVVERATHAQRHALARARWAAPEVGAALITRGDPALDAAVYLNPRTGPAIRARIMAGPTPPHPAITARVCTDGSRKERLPALWSGDPLLVRAALLRPGACAMSTGECLALWQDRGVEGLRPHARTVMPSANPATPQPFRRPRYRSTLLIALLRLTERAGVRAALDLVDDLGVSGSTAHAYRELLAGPDPESRLRAAIDAGGGTARLIRRLRGHLPGYAWPLLETPDVDWDRILAAQARKPFPHRALALLATADGCPPGLRHAADVGEQLTEEGVLGRWPIQATWWEYTTGKSRSAALIDTAVAVAGGSIPPTDVLTGVDARVGIELVVLRERIAPSLAAARELHRAWQDLLDRHVTADPTAFAVVALRLIDDFEGSLAELVTTAAAATAD